MQIIEKNWEDKDLERILKEGGIAVIPTDTVYGIVGRAENISTVEKIYQIRKRNPERPCIIIIGSLDEIEKFSIKITELQKKELEKYWPGPVSIIFDCLDEEFKYLHRGTKTLAFRLSGIKEFREFLLQTGPLIAPSANIEGLPTSKNINEAKKYFGGLVDFYQDGGEIEGKASKVIRLHSDGSISILRE